MRGAWDAFYNHTAYSIQHTGLHKVSSDACNMCGSVDDRKGEMW